MRSKRMSLSVLRHDRGSLAIGSSRCRSLRTLVQLSLLSSGVMKVRTGGERTNIWGE